MGVFSSMLEKLGFGKDKVAEAATLSTAHAASPAKTPAPAAKKASPASSSTVDVVAVCEALAKKNPEKLNWRTSITDLLKVLGLDASLTNRKALAGELGCPKEYIGGDYSQMNVWLHKTVLQKLAENGGKVEDLL